MTSQVLAPALQEGDEEVEQSLRPRRLADFVGQSQTKLQLEGLETRAVVLGSYSVPLKVG